MYVFCIYIYLFFIYNVSPVKNNINIKNIYSEEKQEEIKINFNFFDIIINIPWKIILRKIASYNYPKIYFIELESTQ